MNFSAWLLYGLSFGIALVTTGLVRHVALKQRLVDVPNERSSHTIPTPRGGGLGFILAFFFVLLISGFQAQTDALNDFFLILTLLPLAVVGFLDDRFNLSSVIRYCVQLGTALLAISHYGVFPQPWFTSLGLPGQAIAVILTTIAITALINFYNFMDGLDGLITTVTMLQLGFLVYYLNQPLWGLLIAALLGFLYWNWSPAKIFMGDVGSTVLGGVVAIALIQAPTVNQAWASLAITLPITADTIYTLSWRLLKKQNIFQAHRSHIFQRLQQSGWSHAQVSLAYAALTVVIALCISVGNGYGAVISLGLTLGLIVIAEAYLKRNSRP